MPKSVAVIMLSFCLIVVSWVFIGTYAVHHRTGVEQKVVGSGNSANIHTYVWYNGDIVSSHIDDISATDSLIQARYREGEALIKRAEDVENHLETLK